MNNDKIFNYRFFHTKNPVDLRIIITEKYKIISCNSVV